MFKIGDRVRNISATALHRGQVGIVAQIGGSMYGREQVWARYEDGQSTWLRAHDYEFAHCPCPMSGPGNGRLDTALAQEAMVTGGVEVNLG